MIRIRHATEGIHVRARVFVGPDTDHLALSGTLMLREGEWHDFIDSLGRVELVSDDPAERRALNVPNPLFCLHAEKCAGLNSCPRERACND